MSVMSLQVGDAVGAYKITGLLGAGGVGQVFQVEHTVTGRIEAMKVLLGGNPNLKEQALRFHREIQVQASLNHPNIAAVHNAFWENDNLVMIMEWVEGESLDHILRNGPLPITTSLDYACQALSALSYAHGRGVTHRDISPANVIVTPAGIVKLTDFGLAKVITDARLTQTGTVMGSLYYMSPEQIRASPELDHGSDLYSLGAVLYEMVTGERPFESDNSFSLMLAHVQEQPRPPIERNPRVPPELSGAILKALAKGPDQRFASAESFERELWRLREALVEQSAVRPETGISRGDQEDRSGEPHGPLEHARNGRPSAAADPRAAEGEAETSPDEGQRIVAAPADTDQPASPHSRAFAVLVPLAAAAAGLAVFFATTPTEVPRRPLPVAVDAAAVQMSEDSLPAPPASKVEEDLRASPPNAGAPHVFPLGTDAAAESVTARATPEEVAFPAIKEALPDVPGSASISDAPPRTNRMAPILQIDTGKTIHSLGLSNDGRLVAAGIGPSSVRVWEAGTGKVVATLSGHSDRTAAVSFSPDGGVLATGSWDGTAKLWDLRTFRERRVLGHQSSVNALAFSADGAWLASGASDRSVGLWHLTKLSSARQFRAHQRESQALAFSPNGKMLAAASSKGTVTVWPLQGEGKPFQLEGPESGASAAAFSLDSSSLTVAGGNVIRTWDIASRHLVDQGNFPGWQYQLAFSANGHCLAIATSGMSPREVRLWDVQASKELARLDHGDTVRWLAADPRARLIASADDNGRIILWGRAPRVEATGGKGR